MNAQHLTTEELLAKATARPWIASGNQLRTTKQIAVATMIYAGNEGTQANAELIRRAVGSFEAMREALLAVYGDLELAEVEGGSTELLYQVQKALALADGK